MDCSLGVTVNWELVFWEFHGTLLWLCCWPNCEQDLDNITQMWKKYLKIKFTIDNNYSKLNISSTLRLEITKSLQETWLIQGFPTWLIQGFPTVPGACPNFPNIFSLDFVKFSLKILFNIHSFLHHMSKHFQTTLVHCYSSRAFHHYHGFGDLTSDNQTNKQVSFVNCCWF